MEGRKVEGRRRKMKGKEGWNGGRFEGRRRKIKGKEGWRGGRC